MNRPERSLHPDGLGDQDFVVVDLETTGFAPHRGDRIVEVAVVRCRPEAGVIDRFSTLINPGRPVGAQDVHEIGHVHLRDAPPFADVAGRVATRLRDGVIVGHNVRFDLAFLAAELSRSGHRLPEVPTMCTMRLIALLDIAVPGRSLEACCGALGVPFARHRAHGAGYDAQATARLLLGLLREARARGVSSLEELGCGETADAGFTPSGGAWADEPRPRSAPVARIATAARRVADTSPITSPDSAAYLDLLDRVLMDRVVTGAEADALAAMARRCGLNDDHVADAHRDYAERLCRAAWEDGELDASETNDLARVGDLLACPRARWT